MSLVYHGSKKKFKIAEPRLTRRASLIDGKLVVVYEGVSLHVTPYKWMALAYTGNKRKVYIKNGNKRVFSAGVPIKKKDKYFKNKIIEIHGKKDLEYSLNKIYGKGGYLYTFDAKHFKRVKGLGANEKISYDPQVPKQIEYIKDPVKAMKNLGVKFRFINENE